MEKDVNSLDKINVVGDRVLVKPRKESERSESGLYLPPGVSIATKKLFFFTKHFSNICLLKK